MGNVASADATSRKNDTQVFVLRDKRQSLAGKEARVERVLADLHLMRNLNGFGPGLAAGVKIDQRLQTSLLCGITLAP